ncbi:MaoC family dehydratase [Pigmentiphaga soli]|uniref:MaoC family dehydratase n=1 Tax=Pigmentiphaga soli TaxID=1007095 RepID=A0ABP8HF36_9BURK
MQHGDQARFFEDFQVGERWVSKPVTVTADAIIEYARANDPQPMHLDPEAARAGPFGTLVASGWQIAALSMRVFLDAGGYGKTPMVGMGIDELRWTRPVKAGDTLVVEREVIDATRSNTRPGVGTIRTRVTVRNQHGETVMSLVSLGRVPARAPARAPA